MRFTNNSFILTYYMEAQSMH